MSGGSKRILSPFTGCKKRKVRSKTREKYPILLQELINNFAVCKHCSGTRFEDVTNNAVLETRTT